MRKIEHLRVLRGENELCASSLQRRQRSGQRPWTSLERSRSAGAMRQLKGKPKKETSKDKKERKQAMQEARQQISTVVLPTLAVVVLLIVVFVYVATRPGHAGGPGPDLIRPA
ncbi:hypothetical protein COCON_G00184640 [Conger conger]|uniref:Single-pass membrane and coiled-coil domain-containing protein 4 n=1 Tax=Conger conger TaxID=82655 RepID=A0A9Q1D2G3_CONCO|nr:hypothetical protein COCON_G00184640 [Conger conger]